MATAPAEVLPPAKRWKKDPGCLETSPVLPATATADWSSLPYDIVGHIADSFLATNDLDWYMDLRAVCHNWCSATDDPRNSISDSRFRPRLWIVLDEVFESDTRRLLVNTATGRFLHKELPLLRDYYVVTTSPHGLFVLADRSPPHAACVFNPLTGEIIRFTAATVLTLYCHSCCKMYYMTSPHSSFDTLDLECALLVYSFFRRAAGAGLVCPWWDLLRTTGMALKIYEVGQSLCVDLLKFFSDDPTEMGLANDARCFPMEFRGQKLVAIKGQHFFQVLRFESGELLYVKSILNHAIFIGHHRCLVVDADMFPLIEANCIYYTEHHGSSAHIWKYNIKDRKAERISEAADFVKRDKHFLLIGNRPFTIVQLLSSYTISIRDSELALQQTTQGADELHDI
ncbi:unnamed protein product [Triticum turgidum subsp. durum]|uniref:KIB1-4 beta-propeller domain-containing protein n=1 Tax=Triticum turgidum subsp. durum TaxID=4567 RepID=A0A9R0S231_TRITD|nr:unnamed protein product [Triticum turgidum subsp. durum]